MLESPRECYCAGCTSPPPSPLLCPSQYWPFVLCHNRASVCSDGWVFSDDHQGRLMGFLLAPPPPPAHAFNIRLHKVTSPSQSLDENALSTNTHQKSVAGNAPKAGEPVGIAMWATGASGMLAPNRHRVP